jgi:hypothetical protein
MIENHWWTRFFGAFFVVAKNQVLQVLKIRESEIF